MIGYAGAVEPEIAAQDETVTIGFEVSKGLLDVHALAVEVDDRFPV